MALTLKRWLALAAILGAASAAAILRHDTVARTELRVGRDSLWRSTIRARRDVMQAAQHLRVIELADSVRRARPSSDTAQLIIDQRLPEMVRAPLRDLALRSGLVGPDSSHSTRVVILRDTRDSLRGVDIRFGFMSGHYLPPSNEAHACTVLVRVRPLSRSRFSYTGWAKSLERRSAIAAFGGPCAWYEAFGIPGSQVRRWLERGAWRYAAYAPGAMDSTRWQPTDWGYRDVPDDSELRWFTSLGGYRCATGDAPRCADEVLLSGEADASSGPVRTMRIFGERQWFDGLGPRQREFLAGVAAEMGPERFARFWKSDEPVAEAFRRHAGEDIGVYTLRWAERSYGTDHARGPALSLGGALFGTTIATAALAAALLKRRRRELA